MAKTISITNARKDIYKLADEVCDLHEEVLVYNASSGRNVVILSEEDWKSIQETLHLAGVAGLLDSIRQAADEPVEDGIVYNPKEEW